MNMPFLSRALLFVAASVACAASATPWDSIPEGHRPPRTMGRDYWSFFHEWRYSHPLHPLAGAWDNPEIASLPMFRDCGLVYYSGNLSLPKGKATWRKVIGNFGGENGVWKRFESSAKTNCPATMLFHPKCRWTPALAGEIDLDHGDYAEWKRRHPNLVSVRFQSEWGVDLVQRMLGRDREKDPAARAVLQEVWNRWSWTNRYDRLAQAYWYMDRHIDLNYGDLSVFESFRSANFLDHMAAARAGRPRSCRRRRTRATGTANTAGTSHRCSSAAPPGSSADCRGTGTWPAFSTDRAKTGNGSTTAAVRAAQNSALPAALPNRSNVAFAISPI